MFNREMIAFDGKGVRWLREDLDRFLDAQELEVLALQPIASQGAPKHFGNRLMVELAVFTVTAYRDLLHLGIDEKDAQKTIADVGWAVYSELLSLNSLPFRLISRDPGRRLRGAIGLLLRFPFSAPGAPGYAAKSWIEDGNIYTHFPHCPPQSFVRSLIAEKGDRGELDAFYESWCLYDWPGADIIAGDGNRGHYVRNQTLSRGDPVCDMCWAQHATGSAEASRG